MNLSNIMNKAKTNFPEIIAFVLFCISTTFISFFHEPWFDEFQAWGISKDTLYNILFVIPHYEGHPPLWHLILKLFSWSNINPELGIKIPNLAISFAAIWLLIFKSPFPRIIKVTLPFTYFLFYQYAVISRPYSLFFLALCIAAILYKNKNEHPYKFISSLAFLSVTSAYGMLLATGITLAWVIELWNKQNIKDFLADFLRDKRFFAMLILFFVCLALAIEIFPIDRVTASSGFTLAPVWQKILYFFLVLPADASILDIYNYSVEGYTNFFDIKFLIGCMLGLCISTLLFINFKKLKQLPLFTMTYFLLMAFGVTIYMAPHHVGLILICVIFCFWCAMDTTKFNPGNIIKIFILTTIITQLYWSCISYKNEITHLYSPARNVTSFIKDNSLLNKKIMSAWLYDEYYQDNSGHMLNFNNKPRPFFTEELKNYNLVINSNLRHQWIAVNINPYFQKNIFYNFNIDNHSKEYILHYRNTDNENRETAKKWVANGKPDIILGNAKIEIIFGKEYKIYKNYIEFENIISGYIWKDKKFFNDLPIYVTPEIYYQIKDQK